MYIYCYKNKTNGHKYVGQTKNLKSRYSAHKSCAYNKDSKDYNSLFHQKIREYGLENFEFYVLEEINSGDLGLINEREIYWIKKERSWVRYGEGYNVTTGGENFKKNISLSDNEIKEIQTLLLDTKKPFTEIAKQFDSYREAIARVNTGKYGFSEELSYPLRATREWSPIPQKTKEKIVEEILLTNQTLKEIARKFNISYHLVMQINTGESNLIGDYNYPLRKAKNKKIPEEVKEQIKERLLIGEKPVKIAEQFGVHVTTIYNIKRKFLNL